MRNLESSRSASPITFVESVIQIRNQWLCPAVPVGPRLPQYPAETVSQFKASGRVVAGVSAFSHNVTTTALRYA